MSDNGYIDVADIPKHQRKEKVYGFFGKVKSVVGTGAGYAHKGLTSAGEKYKDYRSKAPERRVQRMEKLKDRTIMMKERQKQFRMKQDMFAERQKSMEQRKKQMKNMPSMFGGGGML